MQVQRCAVMRGLRLLEDWQAVGRLGAFNPKEGAMKRGMMNLVFIVGAAMLLAACSGSGDEGGGGGTPVAATTLTGTFVDAPVAGLSYATSSGLSGTTSGQVNNLGQFNYRPGDTVTFSYGQTVIGVIPGVPQVTPWTVFGLSTPDPANPRWVNLARLLQTFNNALPPVTLAIAALTPIDFNQADAAFTADPNVAALLTTASSPGPLVSTAAAITTLQSQFAILGSWFAQNQQGPGTNFVVFTAMADGTYVISEDGSSDPTGIDGMERGTYTYDQATGAFTGIIQRDTNGANGLEAIGNPVPPITMIVTGNTLTVNGVDIYTRVIDTAVPVNPLVGAWRFDNTDGVAGSLVVLTLFENGTFVLVTEEALPTSDGIERGTYVEGAGNNVTFTRSIDTSATAGLFDPAVPGLEARNIVVNGDTMTLTEPGSPSFTGTRIRPPQ